MLVLGCLGLRLVLWCENPFARFGGTNTLAPRVLWATVLGFIMVLIVTRECSNLRVGSVRACVRACDDACMYGICRVMMRMRGEG